MRFGAWLITNYEFTMMWNSEEQTTELAWLQRPADGLLLIETMHYWISFLKRLLNYNDFSADKLAHSSKPNASCKLFKIDHFAVVSVVAWPLNESEAGNDLVLTETTLLFLCL